MKTNITMKSTDRSLFGVTIRQHTKNGHISITDLQKAYEKARWQNGWSDRRINDILQTNAVHERIYYLLSERNSITTGFPAFIEMVNNEGIIKVLKGLDVWKTTGRGENKAVFSDPYIWVLLAMELNPIIYAKVVTWLTDSLIFDRITAGNEYKPMNVAIKRLSANPDYAKYAKLINIKVFGEHQTGMRNLATASELRKIGDIEKFITQGVEMGMITAISGVEKAIKLYK